ncbi:unnamed protein product [Prorocentrum cordatum]|uniref:Cytochrome b5 heme-binding domain-containing protein n=1 Tax=Prorocentrum cordatum TaxID=2364126 RepID=A0ABN9S3P8_9DINO|nr:unnamed protein product [Polarella glacialis]
MSVTAAEMEKHNTETDCWCAVGGKVYDVTKFMPDHPGGKKAIMLFAGKDATEEFDMLHDRKVIKKYGIDQGTVKEMGTLAPCPERRSPPHASVPAPLAPAMSVTAAEMEKHNTETDCWCAVGGKVYDVTKFMPDHPGGKKAIMLFAGKDATEEFDMLHDRKVIKKYGIDQGTVKEMGTLAD